VFDEKGPKLGAGKLFGECGKVNFGPVSRGKNHGGKGFSGLTLEWGLGYL